MKPRKPHQRRVYIRHTNKQYANGDAVMYKHDPGITEKGVEKSKMVAEHLVEQWGIPDKIIVSPYRRTRETAQVMKSALPTTKDIPIYIDREVSEYLGNHRTIPIDVTESTLAHDPPHPETFSEMKLRVRSHHQKITNYTKKNSGVIWIVTHGLIMKQVAALSGNRMPKEFPSLTCLSIMDGEAITKGELIMFHDGIDNVDDDNMDDCSDNEDSLDNDNSSDDNSSDDNSSDDNSSDDENTGEIEETIKGIEGIEIIQNAIKGNGNSNVGTKSDNVKLIC